MYCNIFDAHRGSKSIIYDRELRIMEKIRWLFQKASNAGYLKEADQERSEDLQVMLRKHKRAMC